MEIIQEMNRCIAYAKTNANNYTVCFIANVDGYTKIKDSRDTSDSILTEYFTEDEYNTILNAIRSIGFRVKVFFEELDFIKYVSAHNYNGSKIIVFNLARNGKGLCKKALIPAFCEFQGIPHTGSDAYTVCLGRHKYHYNKLLSTFNLNVVKSWLFTKQQWLFDEEPPKDTMVIIKPMYESASRGVHTTSVFQYMGSEENYSALLELYEEFQQDIVVQEFIPGYEVQIPIVVADKAIALGAVGISMSNEKLIGSKIITYDIAFSEEYNFYLFNNDFSLESALLKNSEKIATILNMKNYGRCDYRIDVNGNFYLTDISTHPYLIYHSAFAYLFENMGYTYTDIFAHLIGNTILNNEK